MIRRALRANAIRQFQFSTSAVLEGWKLIPNFIDAAEEENLLKCLDHKLKSIQWTEDHFDAVIQNYREVLVSNLSEMPALKVVVNSKIRPIFDAKNKKIMPIHILELKTDSCIKPHVDNPDYSGDFIAALSLAGDCEIRFTECKNSNVRYSFTIPRRSLYIQQYHKIIPIGST